jgi:hypothetical protein
MTCLGHDLMTRSRTYIVLVTETVVAFDIAQTITDYDQSAKVFLAKSMTEAEAAMVDIESVEIAFIAGCPSTFSGSALHRDLVMRGGRIVLLGIEAEVTGPTPVFDVLPQPFDTDAVIAKLRAGHANCA